MFMEVFSFCCLCSHSNFDSPTVAGAGADIASVFHALTSLLLLLGGCTDLHHRWWPTTRLPSSCLWGFLHRGRSGFFEAEKRFVFWVRAVGCGENRRRGCSLAFSALLLGRSREGGLTGKGWLMYNYQISPDQGTGAFTLTSGNRLDTTPSCFVLT